MPCGAYIVRSSSFSKQDQLINYIALMPFSILRGKAGFTHSKIMRFTTVLEVLIRIIISNYHSLGYKKGKIKASKVELPPVRDAGYEPVILDYRADGSRIDGVEVVVVIAVLRLGGDDIAIGCAAIPEQRQSSRKSTESSEDREICFTDAHRE